RSLEFRHETGRVCLAEAGADLADVLEPAIPVDACQQRAEAATVLAPAADDDLLSGPALRLHPAVPPAGPVRVDEALGNDAFQRHSACGQEDGVAGGFEMLDVAYALRDVPAILVQAFLQPPFAPGQRHATH